MRSLQPTLLRARALPLTAPCAALAASRIAVLTACCASPATRPTASVTSCRLINESTSRVGIALAAALQSQGDGASQGCCQEEVAGLRLLRGSPARLPVRHMLALRHFWLATESDREFNLPETAKSQGRCIRLGCIRHSSGRDRRPAGGCAVHPQAPGRLAAGARAAAVGLGLSRSA